MVKIFLIWMLRRTQYFPASMVAGVGWIMLEYGGDNALADDAQ